MYTIEEQGLRRPTDAIQAERGSGKRMINCDENTNKEMIHLSNNVSLGCGKYGRIEGSANHNIKNESLLSLFSKFILSPPL